MGNGQEKQLVVYEELVCLGSFTPHELWIHRDMVVEIAERAFRISLVAGKRVAELRGATRQREFYPAFRRLLKVLEQPAAAIHSD